METQAGDGSGADASAMTGRDPLGRVLLVDDDPIVLEALADELGPLFEIDRADSAEAAEKKLVAGRYDALVSDVRMPGKGGVALLERAAEVDPDLVRIFLTGFADAEVYKSAKLTGAYQLRKPWGCELELVLRNAIQHRHNLERLQTEIDDSLGVIGIGRRSVEVVERETLVAHMQRSLRSLAWVRQVEVTPFDTEDDAEGDATERSDPLELEAAAEGESKFGSVVQHATLWTASRSGYHVRIEFLAEHDYARRVVQLTLRQTADALRMRQLADDIGKRSYLLESARDEFMRRDRLATLGALASSIAHDVRSPLTVLMINQSYLDERIEDPPLREAIGDCRVALDMIENVIGTLSNMASEPGDSTRVPLSPMVERALRLLRSSLRNRKIRVETEIDVDHFVHSTSVEVSQILINLLTHASHASPPGSTLQLHVRRESYHVVVSIHDRGPRPEPHECEEIFSPLHAVDRPGAGLSLSILRQMARHHGGDLLLRPSGDGGNFELKLLAHEG
ncbi:MAG: hybrid sensor histidine kinase/response regulator [Myxococcales bacterium]|nr:hybrid sensor histidine kinase/response regulator [Myxococcales bacterium]